VFCKLGLGIVFGLRLVFVLVLGCWRLSTVAKNPVSVVDPPYIFLAILKTAVPNSCTMFNTSGGGGNLKVLRQVGGGPHGVEAP